MKPRDDRPASGSCAACEASLGLASVREEGAWYCSTACALGRPGVPLRQPAVPESWLYPRPRRHFAARRPRELQPDGGADGL